MKNCGLLWVIVYKEHEFEIIISQLQILRGIRPWWHLNHISVNPKSVSKAFGKMDTGKKETALINEGTPPRLVEGKESSVIEDTGEWDKQEHQVSFVFLPI